METSLWSHPDSMLGIGVQSSVFSYTTESSPGVSSPCSGQFSPPWIGANAVRVSLVTADSLDRDGGKVADTHNPESLVGQESDAAVTAWNRIRLLMAIAPFQTLVRPTSEVGCISTVVSDGEASMNVFSRVSPLGRRFDPAEPHLYVRPRCFAPTLGRFLPRDPL